MEYLFITVLLKDRLGQTNTDGERVQEFVRSIRPTQPIQRNDFSNIGLPPQNDNWDNISITSVSAHTVPHTQVMYSNKSVLLERFIILQVELKQDHHWHSFLIEF